MNDSARNKDLLLLKNFDLSIVIPLSVEQWDKFVQLQASMVRYYQRNGIEVILIYNDIAYKDIEAFIKLFPMVDWKVIETSSKNPMVQINTGIRHSLKKYITIIDSGWKFQNDVIYLLRKDLDNYPDYYAVGQVLDKGYGGIMARKEYFEEIKGLDENCIDKEFGYENLNRRMELSGVRKLFHKEAILVAYETSGIKKEITQKEYDLLLPVKTAVNNDKWGCKPNIIVYDWKNNPFTEEQCKTYLTGLVDYSISSPDIFNRSYRLIALIPTYQESERIADCLRSAEKHCDGIIVLDDESTDHTYELVESEKLLLKAKKKRTAFNDKQNRNILLDLAYFFRSEWFIFMDADERFDERFVDLPEIMKNSQVDTVGVWIANLWNRMETYRTDWGDSNPISQNGLWFRWRMFKNKGRMQIIGDHTLHFKSVPYINNICISHTLFLHLGYLTNQKRKVKYSFYKKEDKLNLWDYESILVNKKKVKSIHSINKKDLYCEQNIFKYHNSIEIQRENKQMFY